MAVKLSVLDFVPLREGQSSTDAITASLRLAQTADRLGFERYWVSEHHDMPYASTHPAVLISLLAAKTDRIRVGSGGVMVPNHTAFDIAEQFAFLEAAYPGRIDLGIGRAPAGNPAAVLALREGRAESGRTFAEEFRLIGEMLHREGTPVRIRLQPHRLKAQPAIQTTPDVWMLGSSARSALLAAEAGAPYVFAHHFFGRGASEALDTYRENFTPSPATPEPRVIITMNAVVARTEAEAHRLALPNLIHLMDAITGRGEQPLLSVEEAEARGLPAGHEEKAAELYATWVVGDPSQASARIEGFAHEHGVSEIMIQAVAGSYARTSMKENPTNEATLEFISRPARPDAGEAVLSVAVDRTAAGE